MATQTEKLILLLKNNWMSNFQMQQELKSSSADREARRIRKNPPEGYIMVQRVKACPVHCLEYKLQKLGQLELELA